MTESQTAETQKMTKLHLFLVLRDIHNLIIPELETNTKPTVVVLQSKSSNSKSCTLHPGKDMDRQYRGHHHYQHMAVRAIVMSSVHVLLEVLRRRVAGGTFEFWCSFCLSISSLADCKDTSKGSWDDGQVTGWCGTRVPRGVEWKFSSKLVTCTKKERWRHESISGSDTCLSRGIRPDIKRII